MSIAKVIEIIASSKVSFDDAMKQGLARATDTVSEVTGAWVKDQKVTVNNGKITEYRVTMKVTFLIKEAKPVAKKPATAGKKK
jgi:flavin-binding protein dodecin